MKELTPRLYLIAGPNGAGKTTASMKLLPSLLNCDEFVNADEIARGLSPFHPESVAIAAGRLQLERIDYLLSERKTFAIETTLSSGTYVKMFERARALGYQINLIFISLDSAETAIERVARRVSEGGHNIPEDTIIRRYERGLKNFFNVYKDNVDAWSFFDNTAVPTRLISSRGLVKDDVQRLTDALNQIYKEMLIEKAALGREVITADTDGVVRSIPAAEVLKRF